MLCINTYQVRSRKIYFRTKYMWVQFISFMFFVILTFFYFDTSRCFASAGINLEVENICYYKIYVGTIYMMYVF